MLIHSPFVFGHQQGSKLTVGVFFLPKSEFEFTFFLSDQMKNELSFILFEKISLY